MEKLKHPIIWLTSASWSDKLVVIIICVFLLFLIIRYGFMKINPSWLKIDSVSGWKVLLPSYKKLIFFAILGIFSIFVWFFFPQIKLWFKFKGVERAQIAKAIKPLETKLDTLAEKAKTGEGLSDKEAVEMQLLKKAIVAAKKKVKEGPPSPPKVATKPKKEVWDWTFEWEAETEHLASRMQKVIGRINDAQIISRNDNVLKFRYKRPSGKIVDLTLDRDNPETEYYFGRAAQSDLYIRVWLLPDEKENFKGRFDNGPGKVSIEAFLKKKF